MMPEQIQRDRKGLFAIEGARASGAAFCGQGGLFHAHSVADATVFVDRTQPLALLCSDRYIYNQGARKIVAPHSLITFLIVLMEYANDCFLQLAEHQPEYQEDFNDAE